MMNFEARNGNFETSAVVKNQRAKQGKQRTLGDCWQWKANGKCSKGDNCSFRHFFNKRAKSTQPNPSPRSSTQQRVQNASRTKSPRGRRPSGKMARRPCKDYLKGTCTTPFCEKWHPPECLFYKSENGWPGGWGPQGVSTIGGGGLARVPNLRVCEQLSDLEWHTQEGKDELTSCRGTVLSAWQYLQ